MKSLLLATLIAPAILFAQGSSPSPVAASVPIPAITPPPAAPAASPVPSNAANAAFAVPLPGQTTGPMLEGNLQLMPAATPHPHPHGHGSRSGRPVAEASPRDTFGTELDIRTRVRMRQAQTLAFNDPAIRAEWVAAHNARTDPERRKILALFYNHLFDRMIHLDPTIARKVNVRRVLDINRMKYSRLGDFVDSDPFATPAPADPGPNPPPLESSPVGNP